MTALVIETIVILLLLVLNGALSMSEMALVASRRSKLRQLAAGGNDAARVALELATDPNRFLSTVQTGITLVGLLAGAIGGVTIATQFTGVIRHVPWLAGQAEVIAVGLVVLLLTFLSLIIGELVPKRLALANPEAIALRMAKPMALLGRLLAPMIWLLGASTDWVLRRLGRKPQKTDPHFADEVRQLLQDGMRAGVFHRAEPSMVESVLSLDQLPVRQIMTPATRLLYLNLADNRESIWHKVVVSGHSNYPVYQGTRENVVGVVSVKSIYANQAAGVEPKLADLMTQPLRVSGTGTVTQLLESFRSTEQHIAMVIETTGAVIGMVTLVDVLEAIVGEMPSVEERLKPAASRRPDGSWLVDGSYDSEKLGRLLKHHSFPGRRVTGAQSLAALVTALASGPVGEGTTVMCQGCRLEVIDMEGERIRTLLVTVDGSPVQSGLIAETVIPARQGAVSALDHKS